MLLVHIAPVSANELFRREFRAGYAQSHVVSAASVDITNRLRPGDATFMSVGTLTIKDQHFRGAGPHRDTVTFFAGHDTTQSTPEDQIAIWFEVNGNPDKRVIGMAIAGSTVTITVFRLGSGLAWECSFEDPGVGLLNAFGEITDVTFRNPYQFFEVSALSVFRVPARSAIPKPAENHIRTSFHPGKVRRINQRLLCPGNTPNTFKAVSSRNLCPAEATGSSSGSTPSTILDEADEP